MSDDTELDLIERIRRDPGDAPTWQVLGDVLVERGDPRGTVIALDDQIARV